MIKPQLIYVGWCAWLALMNYRGIAFANVWINHAANAGLHLGMWWGALIMTDYRWEILFVMPFIGKLFFDMFLNKMRKLPFSYIPREPESRLDRVEWWIFGDGTQAKIFYIWIIAICNTIYLQL
jgi:hypothetical protein